MATTRTPARGRRSRRRRGSDADQRDIPGALGSDEEDDQAPDHAEEGQVTIDWDELIADVQKAQARMSRKNEHRVVLWKCEQALTSVRHALAEHSQAKEPPNAEASPRSV